MQVQEVRCLTDEQIEITINNLAKCLKIKDLKKTFDGRPIFSRENEDKYGLTHISKIADNYKIYSGITDNNEKYSFIIVKNTFFDKLHMSSIGWFDHLLEDHPVESIRPYVYISPAYVITQTMMNHVPNNILKRKYRFVSLTTLYPLLGSENGMFGVTRDYQIVENESYNQRKFPQILDTDPIVAILNANVGEIIQCKRIICDFTPYEEIVFREVVH
jgi:DNA-directed RNA polymerase subunit H (RpoH/RPB5)